jgi:predicted metal-dependent peptidase
MKGDVDTFDENVNLEYDLDFYIYLLLRDEPFFAKCSRYLRKVPNYGIKTAGVRLNKHTATFELAYNPKFFAGLDLNLPVKNDKERLGILMHEFYHIVLGHLTERLPDNVPQKKHNVTADWAINSLPNMKDRLPEWTLHPEKNGLPAGESMEYYLAHYPKNMEDQDSDDDHSQWGTDGSEGEGEDSSGEESEDGSPAGKLTNAIREIAASKLREIIQKAVHETEREQQSGSPAWGTVSAQTQRMIKEYLSSKLDPKRVLGFFIKTSVRADRIHRITKINKRFPLIHPGRAWNRRAKIAISIDQSGSVSDDMLAKFFGWLNEFAQYADFTVVPFDDQVFEDKIYVWKKGERKARERVLCGGTNFDSPTEYVNKHDFDGHIICTDLCAPKPKNSKVQRMWVTDRACAARPYFQTNERILVVD